MHRLELLCCMVLVSSLEIGNVFSQQLERELKSFKPEHKTAAFIAISGDGNLTAAAWEFESSAKLFLGDKLLVLEQPLMHRRGVKCIAVSPDGHYVATGSYDESIAVWNTRQSKFDRILRWKTKQNTVPLSVRFSEKSDLLISGHYDGTVRIWDFVKGIEVSSFQAHKDWVTSTRFVDDNHLVTAGYDKKVKMWKLGAKHSFIAERTCADFVSEISPLAGAELIGIIMTNGSMDVWDFRLNKLVLSRTKETGCSSIVLFDSQNIILGKSDGKIEVVDLESKKLPRILYSANTGISSLALDRRKRKLAVGQDDGTVKILALGTK